METKDILKKIRTDHQITQDEMAEKLAVTKTSCFPLGAGRVHSKYRYAKADFHHF